MVLRTAGSQFDHSADIINSAKDLSQVENTRRLDRRFGAATLLGALRFHAEHVES